MCVAVYGSAARRVCVCVCVRGGARCVHAGGSARCPAVRRSALAATTAARHAPATLGRATRSIDVAACLTAAKQCLPHAHCWLAGLAIRAARCRHCSTYRLRDQTATLSSPPSAVSKPSWRAAAAGSLLRSRPHRSVPPACVMRRTGLMPRRCLAGRCQPTRQSAWTRHL